MGTDTGSRDRREGVGSIVERLHEVRGERTPLGDRLGTVRSALLAFGEALGGDPEDVTDLPFTETPGTDGVDPGLFVRTDPELFDRIADWLLGGGHLGLVSPAGTGKTTVREVVRTEAVRRDEYLPVTLRNTGPTTPRALYEAVLRVARERGYRIDPDDYWQVRDGIPWATDEARRGARRVIRDARADGVRPLVLVDELEDLPERLFAPLQSLGDAGASLFLSGTPAGRERLRTVRGTLDSRLRYHEGIEPFDADGVAEYAARSLARFRGRRPDGPDGAGPPAETDLFSRAAVEDVRRRTDGVPRAVRLECRELFARAALLWARTDRPADRITVTPALRRRGFGVEPS